MKTKTERRTLAVLIFASLITCLSILTLSVYPLNIPETVLWQRQLASTVFVAICLAGGLATLFPGKCSATFQTHAPQRSSKGENNNSSLLIKGHHPACESYSTHTILLGKTTYCSACLGLFIGAMLGSTITAGYFLLEAQRTGSSFAPAILGQACLTIGFLQFKFKGQLRLFANIALVVGATLSLIGMDGQMKNVFVDLLVTGAALIWVSTRISISQWDHSRICSRCRFTCKAGRKWLA
jgi:hypothetical protein